MFFYRENTLNLLMEFIVKSNLFLNALISTITLMLMRLFFSVSLQSMYVKCLYAFIIALIVTFNVISVTYRENQCNTFSLDFTSNFT